MISVTFTSDVENIVATEHLYQWDNGQKLSISGVDTTADVHFANKKSEKALVVTPTVTSGAMVVPIPNSLLAEPYPIIAYVYMPFDDGARTLKSVTIHVEPRKQPSDFVVDEDEGVITLVTISQRANAVLDNATTKVNGAITDINRDYLNFKSEIESQLDMMISTSTVPNADTVDGKHAGELIGLDASFRTAIASNSNMNDITEVGYYCASNAVATSVTNSPFTKAFLLDVYKYGTFTIQVAFGLYGGRKTRFLYNSNWNKWVNDGDGGNALTAINATNATNATNAQTANTAGGLATTASNVCLRNISFGTADPQVTDPSAEGYVAEGALYGQYEEVKT